MLFIQDNKICSLVNNIFTFFLVLLDHYEFFKGGTVFFSLLLLQQFAVISWD